MMEVNLDAIKREDVKVVKFNPIAVHKFMVEVSVYPNGKVYTKMYPVGQTMKRFKEKKSKKSLKKMEVKRGATKEEVTLL